MRIAHLATQNLGKEYCKVQEIVDDEKKELYKYINASRKEFDVEMEEFRNYLSKIKVVEQDLKDFKDVSNK